MRVTVQTDSRTLVQLLGAQYSTLVREDAQFRISIQNLGTSPVFIEYGDPATVTDGYCLMPGNEVLMTRKSINKLHFIGETVNDNIRILVE